MKLTAAILAGGASSRMGRDKAQLPFGGKTLLEVVLSRVRPLADEVLIVGRGPDPQRPLPGVRFVPDIGQGGEKSSMRGLASALSAASGDFVLLLPCDMPFFDPRLAERMKALARDADAVAAETEGRLEPFPALCRRSLAPLARSLLAGGKLAVRSLFSAPGVRTQIVRWPFGEEAFFNANTPEEYGKARALFEGQNAGDGAQTPESRRGDEKGESR